MLETVHLSIGYGKKCLQKEINLSAKSGDLICLIGPNGCGKSTFLKTLSAIIPPMEGKIFIDKKDISKLNHSQMADLLSIVLTDAIEVENMSVFELVSLGRFPHTNWFGKLSQNDKQKIDEAIEQVNLTHKKDALLCEISDGEKQRAVIAKALTQDTPLVLLDEPTAHLDISNRMEIMMLLRRLSVNTCKTFILSTHELEMAMQIADYIWIMDKTGVQTGIPEDLMMRGKIQSLFDSKSLFFDNQSGQFKIKPLMGNLEVNICGDNEKIIWLKRAFERCGIKVSENADLTIEAAIDCFTIHYKDKPPAKAHSIETLLQIL
ncbi:MAG: ABC transporter ATP-binding protein [Bacteroidales bacterium]|jgi:iron complex transport system ATP-binding protein|nr:ABC transporter ATP-binding protein [Bacteroidales bacterium]